MKEEVNDTSLNSTSPENTGTIVLNNTLNDVTTSHLWSKYNNLFQDEKIEFILIDASEVENCNGIGIALLFHFKQNAIQSNKKYEIKNLSPTFSSLVNNFESLHTTKQAPIHEGKISVETIGKAIEDNLSQLEITIEYIGEISYSFLRFFKYPSKNVRWSEVLLVIEKAGVDAFFLICLIGFLFGLIMSFQSAVPMERFGAVVFVANLVSLSLFRELGPLLTAIILAGRSGSAFAAEIGTMKVNEELDALTTMGLNPIYYLVFPRIIAGLIISPLLSIFMIFFGLLGSSIVIMSFGYPLVTFINQATSSVKYTDVLGGFLKSFTFGFIVSAIGCISGMQTKEGASAVGASTTNAVVSGIIAISITDGIFSILFYILGI